MNTTKLYNAIDLGLFYGHDYGGSTVNEHFLILGNYNFNELKRMDSEFVIGLAQRKNEILDVLGFEIQVSDDFTEKYREYAEFMDCQGLPRN